jgi:hypothetical protein
MENSANADSQHWNTDFGSFVLTQAGLGPSGAPLLLASKVPAVIPAELVDNDTVLVPDAVDALLGISGVPHVLHSPNTGIDALRMEVFRLFGDEERPDMENHIRVHPPLSKNEMARFFDDGLSIGLITEEVRWPNEEGFRVRVIGTHFRPLQASPHSIVSHLDYIMNRAGEHRTYTGSFNLGESRVKISGNRAHVERPETLWPEDVKKLAAASIQRAFGDYEERVGGLETKVVEEIVNDYAGE